MASKGVDSRTSLDAESGTFSWENGDQVAVWAKNSSGTYAFENQAFNLFAQRAESSSAYFVSELDSPMADGQYTYYMCYPVPESANGTTVTFSLPSTQNGNASDGTGLMVAAPASYSALQPIDDSGFLNAAEYMNVSMKHLTHVLRFYVPEGENALGEPIQRIEFEMPQAIAGTVTADVTDPLSASLSSGSTTVTIELSEPLQESTSSKTIYAGACIFPPASAYTSSDRMSVTMYSETKVARVSPIRLTDRTFQAGHITSVPLRPVSVSDYYTVRFLLASNNLGEEVQTITLTLPEDTVWPGTTSNAYTFSKSNGSTISVGEHFDIQTTSESEFRSLSTKQVSVSYESENAIVSETITLADLSSGTRTTASLNCPYLMFQDFTNASTGFNKNGDLSATGHSSDTIEGTEYGLPGWTGNQVAVIEGSGNKALAIRHQNETFILQGTYRGRADSGQLDGIKSGKSVKVSVSFNYTGYTNGSTAPQISYGYTTKTGAISGYYEGGSSVISGGSKIENIVGELVTAPSDGSVSTINVSAAFTIDSCTSAHRLSWDCYTPRESLTHQEWIFIDDIKVQITR